MNQIKIVKIVQKIQICPIKICNKSQHQKQLPEILSRLPRNETASTTKMVFISKKTTTRHPNKSGKTVLMHLRRQTENRMVFRVRVLIRISQCVHHRKSFNSIKGNQQWVARKVERSRIVHWRWVSSIRYHLGIR